MKKIITLTMFLLSIIFISCNTPLDSKYRFDNPVKCFNWIIDNFEYKSVAYLSPTETMEIRKGDCFTLALLFCEMMQDYEYAPEIVSGIWHGGIWHSIAKINETYFDLGLNKIYMHNPFPGYSVSVPWTMANCYKWYADFVE